MQRIELNHWYVSGNTLYISLMRSIARIFINDDECQLEVIDGDRNNIILNFDNIEEAIVFTEKVVNTSNSISDIRTSYKDLYGRGEQLPELKVDLQDESKVIITEADIYKLIINYYGENRKDKIDAKKEIGISNNQIDLHFFLVEHIGEKDINTMLTEGDLSNVFRDYLEFYGRDLIDFKYIGNIRRVGYFTDEERPVFQGIELNTRQKTITRK